jgi:hypothetical protein
MLEAVSEDDMRAIAAKLIELARSGNVQAVKEVLDRCLGRPVEADFVERLEQLEEALGARGVR